MKASLRAAIERSEKKKELKVEGYSFFGAQTILTVPEQVSKENRLLKP